jgi:hypothetical protein
MSIPGLFAFGYPPPVPCRLLHFSFADSGAEATSPPQVFYSNGRYPPHRFYKETSGPPQFPSYPFENMPWPKTPVVTRKLAKSLASLRPSVVLHRVGFHPAGRDLSLRTTTIHFSGLNTEPAISLHPASDLRCRFCLWISLMSCWLNFAHVGLAPTG